MIDHTVPKGPWVFDEAVASVFPDMLQRSIPDYQWMRQSTSIIINNCFDGPIDILDLGCSDGLEYQYLKDFGIDINSYTGLDVSEPMLDKAKAAYSDEEITDWYYFDIRKKFPEFSGKFNVVLSILTLQFIPTEYRSRILKDVYDNIQEKGIFVFVEKTIGESFIGHETMVDSYHHMKSLNGYTDEEIDAKRLSLENSLVAMTARENEQMLKDAGFVVQRYWQSFGFCGWIAFKTNAD